jgi:hypothetical protein
MLLHHADEKMGGLDLFTLRMSRQSIGNLASDFAMPGINWLALIQEAQVAWRLLTDIAPCTAARSTVAAKPAL